MASAASSAVSVWRCVSSMAATSSGALTTRSGRKGLGRGRDRDAPLAEPVGQLQAGSLPGTSTALTP